MENKVQLGTTGINISPIGLGIMQWGEMKASAQDREGYKQEIREIFQTTLEGGINLIDTAEMYGNGQSELNLGECLKGNSSNLVIASKFMPYPWRLTKGELKRALIRSLNRLGLDHVDLYQMHWPFPPVSIGTWMDAMADAVADGLIRAVGVSNYSPAQTQIAYDSLAKHQIKLASNQVRYSLLHRNPEPSGLVDLCRKLGVTIIAYSPLEKGILTGKFSAEKLSQDFRAWRYNKPFLVKVRPLIDSLQNLGKAHAGKTPTQVALNWLTCKGAVPIPGAHNKQQALENAGGLGWQLTGEEVEMLDRVSFDVVR